MIVNCYVEVTICYCYTVKHIFNYSQLHVTSYALWVIFPARSIKYSNMR